MIGLQPVRPEGHGHKIADGSGIFEMVGGIMVAKVGALGCVGDSGSSRRGAVRGNKIGRWRVRVLRIMAPSPAVR